MARGCRLSHQMDPTALRPAVQSAGALLPTVLSTRRLAPPEQLQLTRHFLADLYEARHAAVYPIDHERFAEARSAEEDKNACASWQADISASSPLSARLPTPEELREAAAAVRNVLGTVHGQRSIRPAIATEVLCAHVEELAAWAVGEERVPALVRCFASGL
eukprot:CAMPEP_0174705028 /NCGR_PEP_ID=MMETSP1094-20130205/8401_1 /TAXON_ID=156173 /ORGANISM="Chrysochromulina brevifilum, Strain UTEX LB 985" /LENGTH=161 /DNA_ID=CAMNT_0015903143 /DNA_START=15 /DNA_END=500 /DNA_ORIENTATION=-